MSIRYKVVHPQEPPVGNVVEGVQTGQRYVRLETKDLGLMRTGWYRVGDDGSVDRSASMGWLFVVSQEGELEDVTPAKTWKLERPPAVGTYVTTPPTPVMESRIWVVREDAPRTEPYFWTPALSRRYPEMLREFGEFTEYRGPVPNEDDHEAWIVRP